MQPMIRELLSSKKFVVSLLGVVVMVAVKLLGLPEAKADELMVMASPFVAYVVGQGMADLGKERAKVEKL